MPTIHEAMRNMLETSIKGDQWDEIPMVMFQMEGANGEDANTLVAIADIHPATFLEMCAMGTTLGVPDSPIPPGTCKGIGLMVEGWGMTAMTDADREYVRKGGRIEDLKDRRVECKQVMSVDDADAQFLIYNRGSEGISEMPSDVTGRVPDALKNLFAALKGRA